MPDDHSLGFSDNENLNQNEEDEFLQELQVFFAKRHSDFKNRFSFHMFKKGCSKPNVCFEDASQTLFGEFMRNRPKDWDQKSYEHKFFYISKALGYVGNKIAGKCESCNKKDICEFNDDEIYVETPKSPYEDDDIVTAVKNISEQEPKEFLSSRELKILKLEFIYGYTLKEISKLLELDYAVVRKTKTRSLEKLRKITNKKKK